MVGERSLKGATDGSAEKISISAEGQVTCAIVLKTAP